MTDSETERNNVLVKLDFLNTSAKKMFDNITELASKLCKMPVAFISFVDVEKEFFIARFGFEISEISIEKSFGKITLDKNDEIFIVEDTRKDERFFNNPLVVDKPKIVSYYGVPLKSNSGVAFGVLCVISDETKILSEDQKEMLKVLSKQVELFIEFQNTSKTNNTYQTEIKKDSKDIEEFMAIAIHDLKAPVRAIDSFAKLLHKKHQTTWDEKDQKYIGFILQSTTKMYNLINDLLDYSRSTNNINNKEIINVKELIEELFGTLTFELDEKPSIVYDEFPSINISKIAFTVLFKNLLSNAIKYKKDNQRVLIEIKYIEQNNFMIFSVKDNGIGIESDYFEYIFEPFKRLHTNAKYEGNGLGLAICKKIVLNLNGTLSVNSMLDEGSTFTLKIPK